MAKRFKRKKCGAKQDNRVYLDVKQAERLPFAIESRLKGYTMFAVAFLAIGVFSFVFTKSVFSCAFGLLLAIVVFAMGRYQRMRIIKVGYDMWDMVVVEHTFLTRLQKRPSGLYLRAENGPYAGRICHVALGSTDVVPPSGQKVRLCIPGDATPSLIKDIYYIPQYYGMEFLESIGE